MIVKEYMEYFYKVNFRASYVEDTPEKRVRYINGLRMEIQDEISMLSARTRTMEEAYQCALTVEEKLLRKQNMGRGHESIKGKGYHIEKGKFLDQKEESRSSNKQGW